MSNELLDNSQLQQIAFELSNFEYNKSRFNLTDRIKRGLDPIGMLSLEDIAIKVQAICVSLSVSYDDLLDLTVYIHINGPWDYAPMMSGEVNQTIKLWMILNAVNTIGKDREMDMTEEEFLLDLFRINCLLDEVLLDPEAFFYNRAQGHVLMESKKRFRIEEGVAISEVDNGFIAMAMNGHTTGIIQDADGMLFVAAREIPEEMLTSFGLKALRKKDRGKDVTIFLNEQGEEIVKKVHNGFILVLSRNFDLAKRIARSIQSQVEPLAFNNDLQHILYKPTSMKEAWTEEHLLATRRDIRNQLGQKLEEIDGLDISMQEKFYKILSLIKELVILRDAEKDLRLRKASRGEIVTDDEISNLRSKTATKLKQKIDELRYILAVLEPHLSVLDFRKIIDMAGGAGDLALALTVQSLDSEWDFDEVTIVDPYKELFELTELILPYVPRSQECYDKITFNASSLQEFVIPDDSIVVSKHPCGTLADSIIEKWVFSGSPVIAVMTCCQDKAANAPARYGMTQSDWNKLCRASAKTSAVDARIRNEGIEAMAQLDNARVKYLRRYGFNAELIKNRDFPKGNIIFATR